MRAEALARHSLPSVAYVGGDAEHLPLQDGSCDVAWLSTMIDHIPDLERAASELRRILRRGGRVLIRDAFTDRMDQITFFPYFPGSRRIAEATGWSLQAALDVFSSCGFTLETLEEVHQPTARTRREYVERVRWRANSILAQLNDEEFAAGLSTLERAARETPTAGPVVDRLDLLVLTSTSHSGSESRAGDRRLDQEGGI